MLQNNEVQINMRKIRLISLSGYCQFDQFLYGAMHIHERLSFTEHKVVII